MSESMELHELADAWHRQEQQAREAQMVADQLAYTLTERMKAGRIPACWTRTHKIELGECDTLQVHRLRDGR